MSNETKGRLVVLSGPSGSGKGTVLAELFKKYPDKYVTSISATTRAPRPTDKEGVTYFFKTRDEFEAGIKNGDFLEHAVYSGNYYGTPKKFVEEKLAEGKNVILEIEIQGALQIKKIFPEAVFIFISPESYTELEGRLRGRGTETEESIGKRLSAAKKEAPYALTYDYVILNKTGAADKAADDIDLAIKAYNMKPDFKRDVLESYFG